MVLGEIVMHLWGKNMKIDQCLTSNANIILRGIIDLNMKGEQYFRM